MNHHKRILVIEDRADQWLLTSKAIQRSVPYGEAIWTSSASDALEYLAFLDKDQLPNLILLDLYLPRREDGWQVLQAIKQNTTLNFVPVVVFSHSSVQEDVAASYHLGCSSYIVKPVSIAQWNDYFTTLNTYWWQTATTPS